MAKRKPKLTAEVTVERMPLTGKKAVKPHSQNPRVHPEPGTPEWETLRRSLLNVYFEPLVVNRTNNTLVSGHLRRKVLLAEGYTHADMTVVEVDEAEHVAMMVAANRQQGDDDYPMLAELLGVMELPVLELTGLTDAEREVLSRPIAEVEEQEEEVVPELPAIPVSSDGDLWLLGKHRLICGDSTDETVVGRLMDGKLADLVYTDPPYGVGYEGGATKRKPLAGDDSTSLYEPACMMSAKFSENKAALYLWHAGVRGIAAAAAAAAAAAGYVIRNEIIWNKNTAQFGAFSAQYKQKHEPAYYCFKKGKAPRWFGPGNEVTVWDYDRASVNEYHPTQKPVALACRAIRNSSRQGRIVLDLFLGSGSTLIASERLNRVCYGVELEPAFCDVIVRRWEALTGLRAETEYGKTLESVEKGDI